MSIIRENPDEWVQFQTSMDCCGWGNFTDDLATGPACANITSSVETCRSIVVSDGQEFLFITTVASLISFVLVFIIMISVCCLSCCSEPQDEDPEKRPIY